MGNKIYTITEDEAQNIIEHCKAKNIFIGKLFGKKIRELDNFFKEISRVFKFPGLFDKYQNMDAYLDWIRDLKWLIFKDNYEGFALFIYDYEIFMCNDYKRKEQIIRSFADTVLPYWEDDVIRTTNNGHGIPRLFNIYLIDFCK